MRVRLVEVKPEGARLRFGMCRGEDAEARPPGGRSGGLQEDHRGDLRMCCRRTWLVGGTEHERGLMEADCGDC